MLVGRCWLKDVDGKVVGRKMLVWEDVVGICWWKGVAGKMLV